ncbi:hypothetical protein EUGRSUZ_A00539, partial [Eucalyptus grandis]
WDRSADSWSGVTCKDGLVVGLDLSDESISGGIDGSSSLFKLEFLRSLNLAFNNFNYMAILLSLANLSRLENLNLSNAWFTRQIPAELSRLRKLRTLDLTYLYSLKLEKSSLRSLIGDLGELRELYLDMVNVSAEGSEWCDALSSSVPKLEVLSMSYCSFSGPIDASLMSLANLSVIRLRSNNLSTTVPSFLANFSSLKMLHLGDCGLQGEFPQKVFQVQTLQNLYLSSNELLKVFLLDFLEDSSLETLVMYGTNISGRILDSIGNLRKLLFSMKNLSVLTYLDLFDNSLTGSIPPFGASRNLTEIDLSYNALTGLITSVGREDLLNLELLYLRYNSLEGDIPPTLFTLPRLERISLSRNRFNGQLIIHPNASLDQSIRLDLESNQLQGSIPPSIFKLQQLQYLSLSYNNFSGSMNIDTLQGLGNINYLDLSYNSLSINAMAPTSAAASSFPKFYLLKLSSCQLRTVPQFLANQSNLEILDLSNNNIRGEIPRWIGTLEQLDVLNLSHNHLSGTILDCVIMTSHKVLNLRNNQLSGDIPRNILPTCNLKTLDISENLLQGQIPLSLANCTMLEVVNIGDNQIDGTFPCHFKAMSSLCILILRSNKLNVHMKLQIIDLSSNNFSGTIPTSLLASWEAMKVNADFNYLYFKPMWGSLYQDRVIVTFKGQQLELVKILTIFTSIDFSGNRLDGPIPDTLGNLHALYFLNLSHNSISGSIPPVLGNPHQLESLDLSQNYLSRTIPTQLTNLHFLSFLNLSNNQLVGSIPTSGQFLTFSKSSFDGNLGLCGLQLNKNCSITTNMTKEAGDDGDNDDSEKKWFYLGIPLGFVVGFW